MTLGRRLARERRAVVGLAVIGLLGAAAVFAPALSPHDPLAQLDLEAGQLRPPSLAHPMGTDLLSRDVLSRVLHGARVSLAVAILSVAVSIGIGAAVGLVAGWNGGAVDAILMRTVDAALAIPRVFLLVVVLGLWQTPGLVMLITILGATSWFDTSRLVRAEVASVKAREYVEAARAAGAAPLRIAARHVLPNVAAPLIVSATLGIGQMILIEAGLSFLGIGVPRPLPSWGRMIQEGSHDLLATAPWIALFPGIAIVVTVLAFSLLGDGVQRALDPRRR